MLCDLVKTFFTTGSASLVDRNFAKTRICQQNLDHKQAGVLPCRNAQT